MIKDRVLQGMKKGNANSLNRHIMTSHARFASRKKMLQTGLNIRITPKDANLKRPRKRPGASNKQPAKADYKGLHTPQKSV